ncbi:hypothetical protein [Nostoc sp.]|uniref:hypothetical protein n=1 Tax=Nostoc sp. TaxID=1180 RepID=UPI002FFD2563
MKIRKAFATLTICVFLALTIATFVNLHEASAQYIADCRKLVTGTYLTTVSGDFGSFRLITTITQDGNYFVTGSNQSDAPSPLDQSGVSSVQPYSNVQGSWKCTSDREITATVLNFNYPTATLPGAITRSDISATFDPKAGIVQATATLRSFSLNANPLKDHAPVAGTETFTGPRITPGQ